MLLKLILIFITLPLIDLILLLKVAEIIGIIETIVMVILTGVLGAGLTKREGIATWIKFKNKLSNREKVSGELANGALIIFGAAFLLTPGLITDSIGFLMILPFTRKWIKAWLKNYLNRKINNQHVRFEGF
ncbi:membrane protein FxsA [archaeon SCG-AAA382B04]|nr:membrane protein FxsA [archaeon SCG-AAA382B04]